MTTETDPSVSGGHTAGQIENHEPWWGGPKKNPRLTEPQRRKIILNCVERDGRRCSCVGCGVHKEGPCPLMPMIPEGVDVTRALTVDHGVKGPSDHHASNVRAICQPCNRNKSGGYPHPREKKTEGKKQRYGDTQGTGDFPEDIPITVQRNLENEPAFREYCIREVLNAWKEGMTLTRRILRPQAREYTDTGLAASYSYMERLFSKEGPFDTDEDKFEKTKFITFRDKKDFKLTLEQLVAKYPKVGRRKSRPVEMI